MFKKREIKTCSINLSQIETHATASLCEPAIIKKQKTAHQYSTTSKTELYQKNASDLLDDFQYKANEGLIVDNLSKQNALSHEVATDIIDIEELNYQRKIILQQ
jgi:hypothetical protein